MNSNIHRLSHWLILCLLFPVGIFTSISTAFAAPLWHHQLSLKPDIQSGQLVVSNTLTLHAESNNTENTLSADQSHEASFKFLLNAGMRVRHGGKILKPLGTQGGFNQYRVSLDSKESTLSLEYEGQIRSTPQCEFTQQVCALLNEKGIFLNPALGWYPLPVESDVLHTFDLSVELPDGWRSLSQGEEWQKNRWVETRPQDAIYLLAARYAVYEKAGPLARAKVYLLDNGRNDHEALAGRYLDATLRYLEHFAPLLGDYPYTRFATVESFWESGWGMPSFTLLGPSVLRFPFILTTSFPHEVVHNWWGNSVYIDASGGNWAEGLTAYLADHGLKPTPEQQADYRRSALDKYALFTREGNDFPIRDFRSRHNAATQAVGYSKMLMVFHMLRKRLGDETFYRALREFNQRYRFRLASMNDLIDSFTQSTPDPAEQALKSWFMQWIERAGAPELHIVSFHKTADSLMLELEQQGVPQNKPFDISIPVVIYKDENIIRQQVLRMTKAKQHYELKLPAGAERLGVDPFFDVLRKPLPDEIPPNLNPFRAPGKKQLVVVGKASWWQELAASLIKTNPEDFVSTAGSDKQNQPGLNSVHRGDKSIQALIRLGVEDGKINPQLAITPDVYQLDGKGYARNTHSLVFVERDSNGQAVIHLDAADRQRAEIVLRKLRHYGKYGVLIFNVSGQNVAKSVWQVRQSPLSIMLD